MASTLTPEQARRCVSYGLAVGWIKPAPKPMSEKEIVNYYTRQREKLNRERLLAKESHEPIPAQETVPQCEPSHPAP